RVGGASRLVPPRVDRLPGELPAGVPEALVPRSRRLLLHLDGGGPARARAGRRRRGEAAVRAPDAAVRVSDRAGAAERPPAGDRVELPAAGDGERAEDDPDGARSGRLVRRPVLAVEASAVAHLPAVHARERARVGALTLTARATR